MSETFLGFGRARDFSARPGFILEERVPRVFAVSEDFFCPSCEGAGCKTCHWSGERGVSKSVLRDRLIQQAGELGFSIIPVRGGRFRLKKEVNGMVTCNRIFSDYLHAASFLDEYKETLEKRF